MTWIERVADAALAAVDRLHLFSRRTIDEWRQVQRDAELSAARVREQTASDIAQMSDDERAQLPNRLEQVYLGCDGGDHDD